MGKPGRPKKGYVRLTLHLPPEIKQTIREEAWQRQMTASEVVAEAILDRTVFTVSSQKDSEPS